MAAFEDFARGALLMAIAVASGLIEPARILPLLLCQLLWGSFWGLFPDILDIVWFARAARGWEHADHHENKSHWPLFIFTLMLPLVLLGWFFHAEWYVAIAYFAVAMHYIHDKYPFGDGDINLLRPLQPKRPLRPNIPLLVWLKEKWFVPTNRSLGEIGLGLFELSIALWLVGLHLWVPHTVLLVLLGCGAVWGLPVVLQNGRCWMSRTE
jgi:hypothetical protein